MNVVQTECCSCQTGRSRVHRDHPEKNLQLNLRGNQYRNVDDELGFYQRSGPFRKYPLQRSIGMKYGMRRTFLGHKTK